MHRNVKTRVKTVAGMMRNIDVLVASMMRNIDVLASWAALSFSSQPSPFYCSV